ncbi:MAG: FtsX-like permease family protein [Leptospiraceae bacterium]|nr:FtsX-like permease family protein [Leptospiraceae bacterium]
MKLILKLAIREARSGQKLLFFSALTVMVAAFSLSMVTGTGQNLRDALARESRTMAGSDVRFKSSRPFTSENISELESIFPKLNKPGLFSEEFMTMMRFPQAEPEIENKEQINDRLVRVKTLELNWPQRGALALENKFPLEKLHQSPFIILPAEMADEYGLKKNHTVEIGKEKFTIADFFIMQPGSPLLTSGMAPTVLFSRKFIEQTGLLQAGSRVSYVISYNALSTIAEQRSFKDQYETELLAKGIKVETLEDGAGFLRRFIQRTEIFLTFLAVATLILSLSGTSSALSVFLKEKKRHAAVMRALGFNNLKIFSVYASLASIPGILGSLSGVLLSAVTIPFMGSILANFIPSLPAEGWSLSITVAIITFTAGFAGTLFFTLLPILKLVNESPVVLLREEAPNAVKSRFRWMYFPALFLFLFAVIFAMNRSVANSAQIATGLAVNFLLLYLAAPLLAKFTSAFSKSIRVPAIKLAIRNLGRLTSESRIILVAASQGIFLLAAIFILDASLQAELNRYESSDQPDLFAMDIQPSQKNKFENIIRESEVTNVTLVPLITVRISSVNGESLVEKTLSQSGERSWEDNLRVREYFISYRNRLQEGEQLTEGKFWGEDFEGNEASVDEEWAETLNISLGDTLELDVHGLPYSVTVTSMRKIQWESMRPNSFIILSPGMIGLAPKQFLASFKAGSVEKRRMIRRKLGSALGNITVIDVAESAAMIKRVSSTLALSFRLVAIIAVLAGILLLALTIASERQNRARDAALLKILGSNTATLNTYLTVSHVALTVFSIVLGILPAMFLSTIFFLPVLGTTPTFPAVLLVLLFVGPILAFWQGRGQANTISSKSALENLRAT